MRAMMKNIVAVCDVDKTHAANAAALVEKANGRKPAIYSDYRKLLEDKDIDAVVDRHAGPLARAAEHRRLPGRQGRLLREAAHAVHRGGQAHGQGGAQDTSASCRRGSQQRSDAKFRKAAEYVRNGRIGKIKRVLVGMRRRQLDQGPAVAGQRAAAGTRLRHVARPRPGRPYNKQRVHYFFRFFWDYSGGQMTNWGAHHLDIAQWGLGMDDSGPIEIAGKGEFDPEKRFEVPSAFAITYKYANGVVVECQSPAPKVAPLIPDRKEQAMEILDGKTDFTGCIFEGEKGLLYVNRGVIRVWPDEVFETPIKDSDVRLYESTEHHQTGSSASRAASCPSATWPSATAPPPSVTWATSPSAPAARSMGPGEGSDRRRRRSRQAHDQGISRAVEAARGVGQRFSATVNCRLPVPANLLSSVGLFDSRLSFLLYAGN